MRAGKSKLAVCVRRLADRARLVVPFGARVLVRAFVYALTTARAQFCAFFY